jgi:WD40 repeat protein
LSSEEIDKLLNEATKAARAGQKADARKLLERILSMDDAHEQAWLVLATVVETPRERRICLENVLEINPNNERARQALERLQPSPATGAIQVKKPAETPAPTGGSSQIAGPTFTGAAARRALNEKQQGPVRLTGKAGETTRGTASAWTTQRTSNQIIGGGALFFLLLGVTVLGTIGAIVLGRQPTPTPVAILPSATPVVIIRETATRTPLGTIVAFETSPADALPSWTPQPSITPQPTLTATPTPPPVDGYRLVYVLEGLQNVFRTVRADGTGDAVLLRGTEAAPIKDPAFSPDGSKLAYVVLGPNGKEQIAVADADGSNPQIITDSLANSLSGPVWSPDARTIAFAADNSGDFQIVITSSTGGGTVKTIEGTRFSDIDPAFSPDGSTIVFASDVSGRGSFQIFTYVIEGDVLTQLTSAQGRNERPSFSPDTSSIVFTTTRSRGLGRIFVMRADGSGERPLTVNDGDSDNRDASFSPDGKYIAFSSTRNGGLYQLFIVQSNGDTLQQITNQRGNCLRARFRTGI